jgi:AraC-like DNA-binding protein
VKSKRADPSCPTIRELPQRGENLIRFQWPFATWRRMIRMNVASAIVEAAELELRRPVSSLRPYLGCFWSIATTTGTHLRTLPDACTTVAVECRQGQRPQSFLAGPRLTPADRAPGAGHLLFGVRLQPGVAFSLTRRPIHQIVDRRTLLAEMLPDDVSQMERRLASATRTKERFDILEEFLFQRLDGVQVDPRVAKALMQVEQCSGQLRATQLATHCQVSSRHLNRLLRTWLGFSAKRLARITRFQALLQRVEDSRSGGLAQLAMELGYYDQPHLINEVMQFAALSLGRIAGRGMADFSNTRCG